jgi:acyl-CoA synthetase (AMP-forming)/AMP-acid ligase II
MPDLLLGSDWLLPVHYAPGYPFGAARTTITGALATQARIYPSSPFLTELGGASPSALTYEAAYREVRMRARALASWGLERGDRVGILGPNSADFVLAVLAVLEAGGVGVLLNHRDPEARIASRAAFTGVRFVLYDSVSTQVAHACASTERLCSFAELPDFAVAAAGEFNDPIPLPTDAALIFFTSGTTGAPKAVVQSQYGVAQNALSLVKHHGIGPGQRLLCVLPLDHVNALEFTIFGALLGGGHTFLCSGFDGLKFWGILDECQIHLVSLVPNLLRLLADRPGLRGNRAPQLRYAVSAAAPLPTSTAESVWRKLGLGIVQGYGLSEVTNFSCVMPSDLDDADYKRWMLKGRRTSIGPALPGQEVEIMNGDSPAKPEEEGEVVIRGHCVMSGYLHNEQATAEVFRGGWFHTGDLGYYLPGPDGCKFMHISGRIRDIAKRSGAMVNLLEIDEVLATIPGVADAAATAFPNQWVDEEIGALVVRAKGSALDSDCILEHCRRALPFPETPKAIVFVDEVPRTATGKVRRREMVDRFTALESQLFTERRRAK